MREVWVAGVGMSHFAKQPTREPEDLVWDAATHALSDAGVERTRIQAGYVGNVYLGMGSGQVLLKSVGITGIPVFNVENACASGATALHLAWLAIASGQYDRVLVVGVEQLSSIASGGIPLSETDREIRNGLTMPALYAMRARRHMAEYGTTIEQLARVSVKNRRHSVHNVRAQYRQPVSIDEVLQSRPIAEPLTLLQCCPTSDGAAAVVLESGDSRRRTGVRIRASVIDSGSWRNDPRDMARSELTERTATKAYRQAAVGPRDIDVAEVHDAFTIGELMYYEALGFCELGDSGRLAESGDTELGGRIPVNTSGGLLSKGHPLGATGVAQVVEIAEQLRGRSGQRQVNGATLGLAHCTGGGVAGFDHIACSVHILEATRSAP
jgi:acetyl-CoA acetyltransferase